MKKLHWGILIILAAVALGAWLIYRNSGESESVLVGNFEECVEAGNPVMESYPRQCRSAEGELFVESIVEVNLTTGEYIRAVDWPPAVQFTDEAFTCAEAGSPTERAGETKSRIINGRTYCVTTVLEGAAGSIYAQYAYAAEYNGGTVIFTFSTRASQCGNYPADQKLECEAAQEAFSPDAAIDALYREQVSIGAGDLGADSPRRMSLSGTYLCLPHKDTTGPQTMECALGLKADDGKYYALDFNLMSQGLPPSVATGSRISGNGLFTPISRLSTNQWQKYPIEGIFSVTDSFRVE